MVGSEVPRICTIEAVQKGICLELLVLPTKHLASQNLVRRQSGCSSPSTSPGAVSPRERGTPPPPSWQTNYHNMAPGLPTPIRPGSRRPPAARPRLLHAGGDMPYRHFNPPLYSEAPPRPWGYARGRRDHLQRHHGSPTPVGIRPTSDANSSPTPWLPHARGDTHDIRLFGASVRMAPPRPWGYALMRLSAKVVARGSPTPVGIRPSRSAARCRSSWLPNARGDTPPPGRRRDHARRAPHARGDTP
jgi:hypothetical protein